MARKHTSNEQQLTAVFADDPHDAELAAEMLAAEMQHPDGADEHLFVPLEDDDPKLADELKRRFVERWLRAARLPPHRFEDALGTVELRVAPDDTKDRWRLRLRSFYTGTTYWLYEWDRSRQLAEIWIDETADTQGANVNADRRYGPTPWDEHRRGIPHEEDPP